MHFTTTTTALLLSVASISSAAPLHPRQTFTTCPVVQSGDYIWKISNFSSRQPNGLGAGINALSFNISATNNGTLDFTCSAPGGCIEDNTFYPCGENSLISFAWSSDRDGLLLKQDVSDE
jgi:hypothetical protein